MFYEEMGKVVITSCDFSHSKYYGVEYLKCKGTAKLRNNGFPLRKSKYTTISSLFEIYGEKEELLKIQQALIEALKNDKEYITIYADLYSEINKIQNQITHQWVTYTKILVPNFKYATTKKEYRTVYKDVEKYGFYQIERLEKILKRERKKPTTIVATPKTKITKNIKATTKSIKTKNREMVVVDISEDEIDNELEQILQDVEEQTEDNQQQEKPNFLSNIFGDNKW